MLLSVVTLMTMVILWGAIETTRMTLMFIWLVFATATVSSIGIFT